VTLQDGIFRIVSAVLNISNLTLTGNEESSSLDAGNKYVDRVSDVLGISVDCLEKLLCTKSITDPLTKKKIPQRLSHNMAEINRETFAKIVYDRLFDWIVSRVNVEIKKPLAGKNFKSIGLLDIFGFEVFDQSSCASILPTRSSSTTSTSTSLVSRWQPTRQKVSPVTLWSSPTTLP
jgi:myosin heavy subunit